MPEITFSSPMPVAASELFAWHAREGAFQRLAPPWLPVELVSSEGIRNGQRAVIKLGPKPTQITWVAEHQGYIEGLQFQDRQVRGPFGSWLHTHRMEPTDETTSRLVDQIVYQLPLGPLGALGNGVLRAQLEEQFAYRHRITANDLKLHQRYNPEGKRLRIAISGASGLVGRALYAFLTTGGHHVYPLVRNREQARRLPSAIYWRPSQGEIEADKLNGLDAVIHLAGENVFAYRWTQEKKQRILDSRVNGTRLLVDAIKQCENPPKHFLSASAIGYYGNRGSTPVDEHSPTGTSGFLTEVCRVWEAESEPLEQLGIRRSLLRIGIVLSPQGGVLAQMLPPFKIGAGGPVGPHALQMSWIALDDVIGSIYHVMMHDDLSGPINLVGPQTSSMGAFAKTLGRVIKRPSFFSVPSVFLKVALGEVADEVVLMDVHVRPTRLQESGYSFLYPNLNQALSHLLGKLPMP